MWQNCQNRNLAKVLYENIKNIMIQSLLFGMNWNPNLYGTYFPQTFYTVYFANGSTSITHLEKYPAKTNFPEH